MSQENVLQPGVAIKPVIDFDKCRELLVTLYGINNVEIRKMNGYDDINYLIVQKKEKSEAKYVFKVMNSLDSKKLSFVEGQNKLMLHLAKKGITCPVPIENKQKAYYSVQTLESGEHVIRLMNYIEGVILVTIKANKRLFIEAGKFIAEVDTKMEKFSHEAYNNHKTLWHLDSVPDLRKFMYVVKERERKTMIEKIIAEFERRVLPARRDLPSGIIHGDFNEQNIVVGTMGERHYIKGLLDFGDSQKSCYLYELAIAMAYMMIVGGDVDIGAYVAAGYMQKRKVNELEYSLLKICIEARLCQSYVMGAYTRSLDPENDYLSVSAGPAWNILDTLRPIDENIILESWKDIISRENDSASSSWR